MNLADFKNLFFIHSTVDQAAIVAKHLEHKCFFTKGEILYELTEDKSYEKTTGLQVQNKLLIIVAKLISESYNKLDEVERLNYPRLESGLLFGPMLILRHIIHN